MAIILFLFHLIIGQRFNSYTLLSPISVKRGAAGRRLRPACAHGGVLLGAGVDDGAHQHLQRVISGGEVDDLEAVLDNPYGHELLAVVPPVHHQRVDQLLHDRAVSLA